MGTCCKFIKQIIKSCDFFGTLITFRINDEHEYKSLLGGLSSIIFFLFAIMYISYMSYYFILRKNIDFIYSKKTVNDQPFLDLQNIGYRFAFGLQYANDDSSAITNTSQYFNYSIREVQIFDSTTIIEKPIGIELCTKSHFRNTVDRSFDLRGLSNMYCPILENVNFTVEGTMMDSYYKYYNLEIWLTEYALNNYNQLQDYADKYPLEMSYYFLDNAIEYDDRNNPIPNFLNYIFKGIDVIYQKNTEIILSPIQFSNDENIFINNAQMLYGCTVDDQSDSFHALSNANSLGQALVGKFVIKVSPIMFTLSRSYQKLPSFIADLSGILEQFLSLMLFIVNIFERQAIDNKLIRKMIKFKGSKNCNVNYLLNVFESNNNYNMSKVMEIVNGKKMYIKKNTIGGINSRKNLNVPLKKKKDKIYHLNLNNNYINDINNENHIKELKVNIKDNNITIKQNERDGIDILNSKKNSNYNSSSLNYEKRMSSSRGFGDSLNSFSHNIQNEPMIYSDKTKFGIIVSNDDINKKKKNEENYYQLGILEALFSKLFFWASKKQERRRDFFTKAEEKIHYFFDVYNYIQKMQEIDLLIYTLLDFDQIKLFDFLSRPPLKIYHNEFDIYNEFEIRQSLFNKIGKKQIDDLYLAYNNIRTKNKQTFEDLKLLRLINAEIKFLS